VAKDVESLKNKRGDFNAELQARLRRLVTELQSAQELSQALDKKNQSLTLQNKQLSDALRMQQDDREALIRELVVLRKQRVKVAERSETGEKTKKK
jgi:hypothetical protein